MQRAENKGFGPCECDLRKKMFKLFLLIITLTITTSANAIQCFAQLKWQSYLNGVSYDLGPRIKQDKIYLVTSNMNDGYFTLQLFGKAGKKLLGYRIAELFTSPPAIDDEGNMYISNGKRLVSLSEKGKERWAFDTKDYPLTGPILREDKTIYYASYSTLYAISKEGEELWHYTLMPKNRLNRLTVGINGDLYANSQDHTSLYAFDEFGNVKWSFHRDAVLTHFSAPAVDSQNKKIYIADHNALYALDENGNLSWTLPFIQTYSDLYGPTYPPTVGSDGSIYLDGREGDFHYAYAVNSNGSIKWKIELGAYAQDNFYLDLSPFFNDEGNIIFISHDRRVEKDRVYIISPSGNKLCNAIELPQSSLMVAHNNNVLYFTHYAGSYLSAMEIK